MYHSERINKTLFPKVKHLYLTSFNTKVSESDLQKKYDTSCFGLSDVGFLASAENNDAAAYYGVFPMVLSYNAKDLLIAQSGDTMTSPDHQKKGLFIRLANETYSLAEELGLHFVFGFPNENSYPGFKNKLDWEFTGSMQKYTIKVNTIPLCEISSRFKVFAPLYKSYVRTRLKKYMVPLRKVDLELFNHSEGKALIKKDLNFFNYKLLRGESYLVKYNGFHIFLKAESHLIIGDIGKFESKDGQKLITSLQQLAKKLGCKKIIINVSENHWLNEILSDFYKAGEGLPIGFRMFNKEIKPEIIQFIGADFDTF